MTYKKHLMSKQVPEEELEPVEKFNDDCDKYNCDIKEKIEWIYIFAFIGWIVLTIVLNLWKPNDLLIWLILSLPLVQHQDVQIWR